MSEEVKKSNEESGDEKIEQAQDMLEIEDELVSESALEEKEKNTDKSKGKKVPPLKSKRKKERKVVSVGKAYVKASYNNTMVTLTDQSGNVISWASAGMCGFKGAKKATPYAAQIITKKAVEKAKEYGLREVSAFVKGVGTGRESAVRALNANGIMITSIKDITSIPHNGCRPRKPRRV